MCWSWEGLEVVDDTTSRTFDHIKQNGCLKILIRCAFVIDGHGKRGLIALQSLLTNKKRPSPFTFQLNKPFLKFLWQQMAISKFLSYVYWENRRCEEVSILQSLWTLQRALELLITNPISPLQILYNLPFYIYLMCPQGTTYHGHWRGVSCP